MEWGVTLPHLGRVGTRDGLMASAMKPAVSVAGSTSQMIDMIGRVAETGVTHLVLDPVARGGIEGRLDALRAFMADVAPHFA